MLNYKQSKMKITIKIIAAFFALILTSCMAATDAYSYNDRYSQGYSDGYRAGYYQSPDGYWYAPNVVYLDNNGSFYRNGVVYNSRSNVRNNVIISPKRNSLHNQSSSARPERLQNNIRVQPDNSQSDVRAQQNRSNENRRSTMPQQQTKSQRENPSGRNSGRR